MLGYYLHKLDELLVKTVRPKEQRKILCIQKNLLQNQKVSNKQKQLIEKMIKQYSIYRLYLYDLNKLLKYTMTNKKRREIQKLINDIEINKNATKGQISLIKGLKKIYKNSRPYNSYHTTGDSNPQNEEDYSWDSHKGSF